MVYLYKQPLHKATHTKRTIKVAKEMRPFSQQLKASNQFYKRCHFIVPFRWMNGFIIGIRWIAGTISWSPI